LSDWVSIIVRNNTIEDCSQYGIRTQSTDDIFASIENNMITDNQNGIFIIDNNVQMDLGGGLLNIHRHGLHSGPGTSPVPSVGCNTIMGNLPYDINNNSSDTVKAKYNFWDHNTISDVLEYDIRGNADVDPLGVSVSRDEGAEESFPIDYILLQNYPNPFNITTKVRYYLPKQGHLTIEIFDVLGRRVCQLISSKKPKGYGQVNWDGRDENGKVVTSGIYHIRLFAKSEEGKNIKYATVDKKILLIK